MVVGDVVRCLGMIEGRGDFFCAGAGLRTVFREERGGGVALKSSHLMGTLPAGCAVVFSPVKWCAGKMAKTWRFRPLPKMERAANGEVKIALSVMTGRNGEVKMTLTAISFSWSGHSRRSL